MKRQNLTDARAALFSHALSMQEVWIDEPDLYPYFYSGKPVPVDAEDVARVMVMCEMLADMIDHAVSSDQEQFAAEGWDDYAQHMYNSSPAFQAFMADPEVRSWYPNIGKWITYE